jgi:hypothetical protein
MEGTRFGRLVVVKLHSKDARYNKRWQCLCDCGAEHVALAHKLRDGSVKSCGCLGREVREKLMLQAGIDRRAAAKGSYVAMKKRCYSPSNPKYPVYGGRGIGICDRWRYGEGGKSGFECFFDDMGPKPVGCSVDRIDPERGYSPDNCRWATPTEQSRNRRNVQKVFCDGGFLPWIDVMERLGLDELLSRVNTTSSIRRAKIKELLLSLG